MVYTCNESTHHVTSKNARIHEARYHCPLSAVYCMSEKLLTDYPYHFL